MDIHEKGRKVAETRYLAKILRFSHPEGGHDLALLMVYKEDAFKKGAKFTKDIPKVGDALWHVGSFAGVAKGGRGTLVEGVFKTDELDSPVVSDQVSLPAMPGCSGGGVFRKSDGACIGLVTEGVAVDVQGTCIICPSRRMFEFAKATKCLWALDSSVKVPEDLYEVPVADVPLDPDKLPKEIDLPPGVIPAPPVVPKK